MKVLYLVNQYPKISHTFIRREIQALEKLGVDVVRVTSTNNPDELVDQDDIYELSKTRLLVKGQASALLKALIFVALKRPVPFLKALKLSFRMAVKANFRFIHHLAYLAEACLLLKISQEEKVDHIHAHFGTNPAAIATLTRILGGPTYSFTVHGPEDFDHPAELSMADKIHHASFVVAITSFCKSQLFRWCDFQHWKKIEIVHCGVDDKMLKYPHPDISSFTIEQSSRPFRFINIGRLSEQKGQMLLLEAMCLVHQQGVAAELEIIGDGPFRPQLEAYIEQQGIEEIVKLVGAKSGQDVREALDQADVMVLPSFAEGLPVVIMEALARKKPVISSLIAGIPELVTDQCGWLVPAGDASAIAKAMIKATATDLNKLHRMGENGYLAVSQQHDIDVEASKLKSFFEQYEGRLQ
ncbi:glycosyltransferase family 4 protein [Nitrincola schmidtii]|uniref:glycosyltransferase family 4 protein n=1 Tax=Nitrincola schmidtii TaxID=1730894 RepID=UPI00124E1462|nr:glycosyltransferase family 4 protein [Nitrincola schmidtii]